ncbi:hypothetical protein [Methanobrevibacter sp.]|uniref:hypothetical protein n=1 Tax=Methanobrevibacter sp. TaxID=66852 RepID=UPI0038905352
MNLSKKLLTLLAIFCVIASAGVACAADNSGFTGSNYADDLAVDDVSQYDSGVDDISYNGDDDVSQYDSGVDDIRYDGGYAGSQYQDDGGWAGSQYNETLENQTAANQTADNATNATAPVEANTTANATNATGALHTMLATGNPILVLLAVGAVLGGAAVLRRK